MKSLIPPFSILAIIICSALGVAAQETLEVCGEVSAYTAPTIITNGSITIDGRTFNILAGTTIENGDLIVVGADICLTATVTVLGLLTEPAEATLNVTTTLTVCGEITDFTAATADEDGSIIIGGQTFPIAAGTTITNQALITAGADLCLSATINGLGQVTAPSEVRANLTTTTTVCGVVTAFTPATADGDGSITIGTGTIPIAAGTTITNQNLITAGADLCLSATLNAFGQVTTPSEVRANVTTNVVVCGVVTAFTAATADEDGSITIGGQTFPIAAGTTITNQNLITAGADLCLSATLNAFGQVIIPSEVRANVTSTVVVCGVVTAFTAATADEDGSITVGGQTFPIAAGTTITNQNLITAGADLCLDATLDAFGQIIAPSEVTANLTTTVTVCGEVTAFTAATADEDGSITIGGETFPIAAGTTITNQNLITAGADLCLSATLDASGKIIAPSEVRANVTSTVTVCGEVTAFTAATADEDGSITIGGETFPIAAGTTITNQNLITAGADLCLDATLNAFGQIVVPSEVTAIVTTTIVICGEVTAFTAATADEDGSITIDGETFTIAAGTEISGEVVVGANICLRATIDAGGEIVEPTEVVPAADLSITKSAAAEVEVGDQITYTISVANAGPNSAENVSVVDELPGSVSLVSTEASQGSCSGTTTITCELGNIATDGNATITIVVMAEAAGNATNEARVDSDTADQDESDNEASVTTEIEEEAGPQADLSITKTSSSPSVDVGDSFTYTIRVRNAGPDAPSEVTVTDTLPAEVSLVSGSPSQGACSGNRTITCTLGSLAPGAEATVMIEVNADHEGAAINRVRVVSELDDPQPGDNEATVTTPILGEDVTDVHDVSLRKTATPSRVAPGEPLTYTITVTNRGSERAENITITDALPSGVRAESVSSDRGSCTGDQTVTCTLTTLEARATMTVTIVIIAPDRASVTNRAVVTTTTPDSRPDNNADEVFTPITRDDEVIRDIEIRGGVCPASVCVGSVFTWTTTLENTDAQTAEDVIFINELPLNVRLVAVRPTQGTCSGNRIITCRLGNIPSGGTVAVDVAVTPMAAGEISSVATLIQPTAVAESVSVTTMTAIDCPAAFQTYIPVAGNVQGLGTFWRTELRINNPQNQTLPVTVDWFAMSPGGAAGPTRSETVMVEPGEHSFDDLVSTFSDDQNLGSLRFTADHPFGVSAKVFAERAASGSFGDLMHGLTDLDAEPQGTLMHLSHHEGMGGSGFRTNIGYFNPNDEPLIVTFRAFTSSGQLIGTRTLIVPAFANAQARLTSLIPIAAADQLQDDLHVTFETSGSPLLVYGSVIDNGSQDSNFIEPWSEF